MREERLPPDRVLWLATVATFLFAGGLRGFLSTVYYQNLATLSLNATAAYSLLLLAPALFFVPALQRRPGAVLLAGAALLAVGRLLQPLTRGTAFHLPLAGLAAAGFLLLLSALLLLSRGERAPPMVAAGLALGWALDVALLTYGDSVDPTQAPRGLLLVAPAALFLVFLALQLPRAAPVGKPARSAGWLAGAGLGAWIFVQNAMLGNAAVAARWNGGAIAPYAAAILAGLVAGALVLTYARAWSWTAVVALNALLVLAALDHTLLHSPLLPLLVAGAQVALALDAALLARALAVGSAGRALLAGGAVALVLHFVFAFTFLFDYVPLGHFWKGMETLLLPLAALLVVIPALVAHGDVGAWRAPGRPERRASLVAGAAAALVLVAALATPAAAIPAPPQDGTLRVMSFNVHQAFANDGVLDPSVFVDVLREEDPDVVVIQEGDTPRFTSGNVDVLGYLASAQGYHLAYGQPTREQAFGGAILSRFPIEEARAWPLPSDADNRFFTEARLDVAGRDVWVYAVHLTLPREDRVRQTQAILDQAATRSGPAILAGDFNSCPTSLCPEGQQEGDAPDDIYATLAARYQDAWTANGRDANDTEAYTYDALAPYERIDYVFVTRDVEVVAARTVRTASAVAASDHLPVVAELRLR